MAADLCALFERIKSTKKGFIGCVWAVCVDAEDVSDFNVAKIFARLDAAAVYSGALTGLRIYLAVDALDSTF